MYELSQSFIRMELDDIQRRMFGMIQIGKVAEVDAAAARLRVAIGDEDAGNLVTTALLPWLTYRAGNDSSWWAPEVGEQVIVLAAGGELNNGVVLPAIYQDAHPAPDTDPNVHTVKYADGTTIKYDKTNHALTVDVVDGNITINSAKNVSVNAGGNADVVAGGDVSIDASNVNIKGNNVNINEGTSGGVVCQSHVCSFTGSPHPQGSATVKGGG